MITTDSFVAIAEAAALKGLEPLQQACVRFAANDATTQSMLPDSFSYIPIWLQAVYPDVHVSKCLHIAHMLGTDVFVLQGCIKTYVCIYIYIIHVVTCVSHLYKCDFGCLQHFGCLDPGLLKPLVVIYRFRV